MSTLKGYDVGLKIEAHSASTVNALLSSSQLHRRRWPWALTLSR